MILRDTSYRYHVPCRYVCDALGNHMTTESEFPKNSAIVTVDI